MINCIWVSINENYNSIKEHICRLIIIIFSHIATGKPAKSITSAPQPPQESSIEVPRAARRTKFGNAQSILENN